MKRFAVMILLVVVLALSGCATTNSIPRGDKGVWGAVGGAGAGAIIGQAVGHDTESTLIGTAAGGLLGYIFGNEGDKRDLQDQIDRMKYGY